MLKGLSDTISPRGSGTVLGAHKYPLKLIRLVDSNNKLQ